MKDPIATGVLFQVVEQEIGTASRSRFRIESCCTFVDLDEGCLQELGVLDLEGLDDGFCCNEGIDLR